MCPSGSRKLLIYYVTIAAGADGDSHCWGQGPTGRDGPARRRKTPILVPFLTRATDGTLVASTHLFQWDVCHLPPAAHGDGPQPGPHLLLGPDDARFKLTAVRIGATQARYAGAQAWVPLAHPPRASGQCRPHGASVRFIPGLPARWRSGSGCEHVPHICPRPPRGTGVHRCRPSLQDRKSRCGIFTFLKAVPSVLLTCSQGAAERCCSDRYTATAQRDQDETPQGLYYSRHEGLRSGRHPRRVCPPTAEPKWTPKAKAMPPATARTPAWALGHSHSDLRLRPPVHAPSALRSASAASVQSELDEA